jgi:hypothetical protein
VIEDYSFLEEAHRMRIIPWWTWLAYQAIYGDVGGHADEHKRADTRPAERAPPWTR